MAQQLTVNMLRDNQEVYVINKSKGDFILNLRLDGSRITEAVPVPKTWIPIRLTAFTETKNLKASSDFRKAISAGILLLIDEEEAVKILSTNTGKKELEVLRKLNFSTIATEESEITPLSVIETVGSNNVKIVVKDAMIRTDITEDDKLTILIGTDKQEGLSADDIEYILVTTENNNIQKWAEAKRDQAG